MRTKTRHAKIAAALLVVLITAVTTTAILAYFIYERTLTGLLNSRFEFIAKDLKHQVESGLDLGLPLGELENIRMLLRQHLGSDRALVSLSIVSARGVVLFDTEDDRVGKRVAVEWLEQRAKAARGEPVVLNKDQIGVALLTNYGKVVGGLLLTVSHAYYAEKRLTTARRLVGATLVVLFVGSIVGVFGVLAISHPFDRALAHLQADLRSMLSHTAKDRDLPETDHPLGNVPSTFEGNLLALAAATERLDGGTRPGER